ncbi:MAG: DUF58 domain-containing protein [Ruminococcus sp.]|nr:DUF58 domain-containing protein [Ruminococcus sp.]
MPVLYLILLLTSYLFYILYEPAFSFYLFGFLLLTPVVLFIMTFYTARKTAVTIASKHNAASRSSKMPLVLMVQNRSHLPGANLLIEIEYYNTLDGQVNRMKINTPVYPNETHYLTMHISCVHYGTIRVNIKKCRLYDMLRLFRIKLRYPKYEQAARESSFIIMPDHVMLENNIANYTDMGLETDEYSKHSKGDDPSEIFDIHEYIEGDKINRIHWKLSAKQGKTMVKDYSLPISNSIILMVDLCMVSDKKDILYSYDTIIEAVVSISNHLIEYETPHKAVWYDVKRGGLVSLNITDEESHRMLINMLLRASLYNDSDLSLSSYINESDRYKCGHLMYFSASYSENVTELMNDSDLAFKYSYMIAAGSRTDTSGLYDEFAQIVPIYPGRVGESIQDICL